MSLSIYCPFETVSDAAGNVGKPPVYKTSGAACADIAVPKNITIPPHGIVKVDLLLKFNIPRGYKIVMYPRSSLLIKHGLMQPTSIIDSDYHGHVHAPLVNLTEEPVELEAGERVAQIECVTAYEALNWCKDFVERGDEGFGTTGGK